MRRVSLALMLLLAAPTSLAQEPDLVAHSLTATGDVDADGALRLMVRENDPSVDAAFQLTAGNLRVEVARADPVVDGRVTTYSHNPSVEPTEYDDAQVGGTDLRDGQRWILLPASGTARIEAACLKVEGHASASVQRNPRVTYGDGSIGADTSRTSLMHSCSSDAVLEVEGDFRLVLWEWDIQVQTMQTRDAYWSGQRESTSVPGGAAREYREVYLHATDAYLRVGLAEADQLYVGPTGAHVDGNLLLDAATGHLATRDGGIDVQDESIHLTGVLDLQASRDGTTMDVQVEGDFQQVRVGDRVVQSHDAQAGWPWLVLAVMAGLVVAAWWGASRWYPGHVYRQHHRVARGGGIRMHQERRAMGWRYLAQQARRRQHPRTAQWLAGRAIAAAPRIGIHYQLRIQIKEERNRVASTIADREALNGLLPPGSKRAENAIAAGRACREAGRSTDEIVKWVRVAEHESPDVYFEALADQTFDPVRGEILSMPQRRPRRPAGAAPA